MASRRKTDEIHDLNIVSSYGFIVLTWDQGALFSVQSGSTLLNTFKQSTYCVFRVSRLPTIFVFSYNETLYVNLHSHHNTQRLDSHPLLLASQKKHVK